MRILHITTHLNKGGITSYIAFLSLQLKKNGHNILIASSGGDSRESFLKNGIEQIYIPIRTKNEFSPSVLRSFFILKKYLKANPVDIIHAHTRVAQVLAYFLGNKLKIPVVTTCHGFFKPRWNRRKFPCWGDKTIAISNQVRQHLIVDFKVNEKNICLIHNGVNLAKVKECSEEEVANFKKEMGIPSDFFVVGYSGRFSDVKGLDYLIKAAPLVLAENNRVAFLLVGDGKEEPHLRKLVKKLKLEGKVIFYKPIQDINNYLCIMDIFVMPSLQEGLGISALEAQLRKVPVIASDVGGLPDIIKNYETGLLVKPKDQVSISRAILRLIEDSDLCSTIKINACNMIVKDFSLGQMAIKTQDLYKEMLCHSG